jgi:hypothetical protein
MPESTSISKLSYAWTATLAAMLASAVLLERPALAADPATGGSGNAKTFQPEEDDFSGTPFTEYGEFNEDSDEEADANFFAHGRFFGVSLGLGFEGVTGNRGALWQGGFPLVDFKLHYWFDFNFAIDMELYYASHFFETSTDNGTHVDVNMLHAGVDAKYYFDTKNLTAAISFANPYLMIGFGSYTKAESTFQLSNTVTDTGIGLGVGGGLEFVISPKKAYLELEGRYHIVNFKDTNTSNFNKAPNNLPDLTGGFYTLSASILWTW